MATDTASETNQSVRLKMRNKSSERRKMFLSSWQVKIVSQQFLCQKSEPSNSSQNLGRPETDQVLVEQCSLITEQAQKTPTELLEPAGEIRKRETGH